MSGLKFSLARVSLIGLRVEQLEFLEVGVAACPDIYVAIKSELFVTKKLHNQRSR